MERAMNENEESNIFRLNEALRKKSDGKEKKKTIGKIWADAIHHHLVEKGLCQGYYWDNSLVTVIHPRPFHQALM